MTADPTAVNIDRDLFRAGERVCVAVSGGADSVALLVAMSDMRAEAGLVLTAVHVHHGLRGAEADGDAAFVSALADRLGVPLRVERGDIKAIAADRRQGIEEAAREFRMRIFEQTLRARQADTVATAHTLDDQAETVLMKLLRGAWTEGLGGISPELQLGEGGRIVRPLLGVTRSAIVAYLNAAGQSWREDSTNRQLAFTRNRVRHTLLPQLREEAPRVMEQLARLSRVARDEESWWTRELSRVLPGLVLPGRPTRGGGRANSTQPGELSLAVELERLRTLHPALRRRVLRAAAAQLGAEIGFDHTEALLSLAEGDRTGGGRGARIELGYGVTAERSARELRFSRIAVTVPPPAFAPRPVPVPGSIDIPQHGLRVTVLGALEAGAALVLRTPRAGDRLRPRHAASDKSVKEVLERRGLGAAARAQQPVLAIGGRIVWIAGVEMEEPPGLTIRVESLPAPGQDAEPPFHRTQP